MRWDETGSLIMEHEGPPGCYGDSCAETSRYKVMGGELGSLKQFITDKGYIRHPDSPWREDDFSVDQWIPLFMALTFVNSVEAQRMIDRLNKGRVGNGDLLNPLGIACIRRFQNRMSWFWDLALVGQAAVFKMPIRWSDSKKWFEKSEGSYADYLNWLMVLIYARRTGTENAITRAAIKAVNKDKVMDAIGGYYKNEPASHNLLSLYKSWINTIWT